MVTRAPFTNVDYPNNDKYSQMLINVWDEITYPFPNFNLCSRWSFETDK